MIPPADRDEIVRALGVLVDPGSVVELRVPNTSHGTVSGYFTDLDALATEAARLSGTAPGVYLTANPVDPRLLARATNRVKPYAKATTKDADVLRRRWIPLDLDPLRPADISSTDAEHAAALAVAADVSTWLTRGIGIAPESLVSGDSGNGAYVLVRVDLPNDATSTKLVRQCLAAVAHVFDSPTVHIDQTMSNAARIVKLYGTVACKGDASAERPRRRARLVTVPATIVPTDVARLTALAARAPHAGAAAAGGGEPHPGREFDVREYLADHGRTIKQEKSWEAGSTVLELDECIFNPAHNRGEAAVLVCANGMLLYICKHDSCRTKRWADVRAHFDGPRPRARAQATATATTDTDSDPAATIRLTDVGNARRLVAAHGKNLRYCKTWKSWLVWDGRCWVKDDRDQVMEYAKATIAAFFRDAAAAPTRAEQYRLAAHALRSQHVARLRGMILLAQSEPGIPIHPIQLDATPYLLNVLNGTLDLRTGTLRTHERTDFITKLAPVEYHPDPPPDARRLWDEFLVAATLGYAWAAAPPAPDVIAAAADRVAAAADLRSFLQRAVGYSLTGDTAEEKLFLIHGPEAAGKSTFIEALKATLGDYARTADFETFLAKKGDSGVRNDVARLAGARLVASIEVEQGKKLAETLVKELTGRDTVTARFLFAEFFEFKPAFKLWLVANYAPRVNPQAGATWRRILLLPFEHTVPEADRDPALKTTLTDPAVAGSAILAWAVQGCLAWQRDGLGVPPIVRNATAQYREAQDSLRDFYAQCCVFERTAWVASATLYAAYRDWAQATGIRQQQVLTSTTVGRRLRARGCESKPGTIPDSTGTPKKKARGWTGVRLRTETEAEGDDSPPKADEAQASQSTTTDAPTDAATDGARQ